MNEIRFTKKDLFSDVEMLLFYRRHPIIAIRDIFGINLAPHQRIAIRLIWRGGANNIILLFSRAMGKTFLCALLGLLYAVLYDGISIVFLGGDGFRQGKLILEEAVKIINGELDGQKDRKFLRNLLDRRGTQSPIRKDPDVWAIPFRNKSLIRSAPIGDGNRIRGFRAHITFVDERKDLSKDIRDKVVKPFGILGKNVVSQKQEFKNINIDAGTLEFEEDDYTKDTENYQRLMEEGVDAYLIVKFEYIDAYKEDENGRFVSSFHGKRYSYWKTPYAINIREIEEQIENGDMDEESWYAEYLCRPKRAVGNVFSYHDVKGIIDFPLMTEEEEIELLKREKLYEKALSLRYLRPLMECDDPVVIAVDVARESANTAFAVLRLGPLSKKDWDPISQTGKTPFSNIIFAYQERQMPYKRAAQYIYDLLERYPNTLNVFMDQRGGGSAVRDDLYDIAKDVPGMQVLYDPRDRDEGGVATRIPKGMGDPRLVLLNYTAEDNTVALSRVKAAVQTQKLLLVRGQKGDTQELNLAYHFINEIATEMRIIKTEPTANWLRIVIDKSKGNSQETVGRRTKDLWTTLMYAYGEAFWRYLHKEKKKKKKFNTAALLNFGKLNESYIV